MATQAQYRKEIEANLKWLIGGAVHNYCLGIFIGGKTKLNAYTLTEAIGILFIEINNYLKLLDKDNGVMAEAVDLLGKLEYSVSWADDIQDKWKYKWSTALYCAKTIVKLADNRLSKGDLSQGVDNAIKTLREELLKYRDVHSTDHNSFIRHIQEHKNEFELNEQLESILNNTDKREG